MHRRVLKVRSEGTTFIFYYDKVNPELLHVFARHLMEPDDVIDTFFDGTTFWNDVHDRYETYTQSHYVYWNWSAQKEVRVFSAGRI